MRLRWGLVGLALVAGACGNEDTEPPAAPASVPATTTAPSSSSATAPTTIPLVEVTPNDIATGGQTPTTTAGPAPPPPTTETEPAIPATTLSPDVASAATVVGRGRPLWFSTDGSAVMVAAIDEIDPSPSCDRFSTPALRRLPLDGSTATVGILGPNAEAFGVLARPEPGTVSLLEECAGAVTAVWVGDEAPNGLMARVVEVPVSEPVSFVGRFTPSLDGSAFIGSTVGGGADDATVVSIDSRTGEVTALFPGQYVQISQVPNGIYIGLTWDGEIRWVGSDGALIDAVVGNAYAVGPGRVALITDDALEFGPPDPSSTRTTVALPGAGREAFGVWKLAILADGVAVTRLSSADAPVWLATDDGALVEVLPPDEWGELVGSDDGSMLATSRPVADPASLFAEETVVVGP